MIIKLEFMHQVKLNTNLFHVSMKLKINVNLTFFSFFNINFLEKFNKKNSKISSKYITRNKKIKILINKW
jgi:hypothetical protein